MVFDQMDWSSQYQRGDGYYDWIRKNVEALKLIQIGITLATDDGILAFPTSTWQFNLKFDWKHDMQNPASIEMLRQAGIKFNRLKFKGISAYHLSTHFMKSGLFANDQITWVAFNSAFDFAYLVKLLGIEKGYTGLPKSKSQFIQACNTYFPRFFDVKQMDEQLGSLQD